MSADGYHSMWTGVATITLLAAVNCFSADFWIAQNATGSGSGADTNDCMALATVNSTWPASPGDTVHLCGTLTNTLTVGSSGSAANPITVHFEPNAKFSAPTLSNNGAWIICGQNNIVLDGGSNGLIQLTDNGTIAANGGIFDYNNNVAGIVAASQNLLIENLAIRNIYQRTTNSEPIQGSGDGNDISLSGSGITISNCVLGEAMNSLMDTYSSTLSSNLTVTHCVLTNYNHGITLGAGSGVTPVFNNVFITHNTFLGGDMFESPDGTELGLHRNPIFFFNESTDKTDPVLCGCISNIVIAYNFIEHGWHPQSSVAGSGAMFFDTYTSTMERHVRVYNNISTLAYPLHWSGGGGLISGDGTDVLVANNTAIAGNSGSYYGAGEVSGDGTNVLVYNNIVVSSTGLTLSTYADTTGHSPPDIAHWLSGLYSDYNICNGQGGNSFYEVIFSNGGSTYSAWLMDTFAQWTNNMTSLTGHGVDLHSTTATVQLGANFAPLTNDVVAIGNGTNLTAFGITDDFAGNPRPSTGPWTIGAYEGTSAISAPTISAPQIAVTPPNQDLGMIAVGVITNQTFSVQNTGGGTLTGSVSVAGPLSIVSGGSYSLGAGQSQTVTVSYSPTTAGTNELPVIFSGGAGASVMVTGMAVAPPVVSAITQSGAEVDGNASGLQIFVGPAVQYSGSASDPNGLPLTWQWLYTLNGGSETAVQSGTGSVAAVTFNYTPGATGSNYVWILRAGNGYATNESTLAVVVEATPAADAGYVFQAASGSVTAPFMVTNGSCCQPLETCDPTNGGQAVFTVTIHNAGYYVIQALVNAPDDANNSFFVNIDAQPQAPAMIWDIFPFTSGFEQRVVSWRGNGSDTNAQFAPMYFHLNSGLHQIIFRGREANTQLQSFSLLPAPPQNFKALAPGQ